MPASVPDAPATFSMTTVCPSVLRICSARMRASTSVGPPAANGTMSVICRDGKVSPCDEIGHAAATVPIAAFTKSRRLMRHSPWSFLFSRAIAHRRAFFLLQRGARTASNFELQLVRRPKSAPVPAVDADRHVDLAHHDGFAFAHVA